MSFVNKTNHQYIQGRVASREGVRCQAGGAHDYDRDILKSSYGFTKEGADLASELKGSYAAITSGVTRHNQCGGKKKKKSYKKKMKKKSRKKKRKRTRKGGFPSLKGMRETATRGAAAARKTVASGAEAARENTRTFLDGSRKDQKEGQLYGFAMAERALGNAASATRKSAAYQNMITQKKKLTESDCYKKCAAAAGHQVDNLKEAAIKGLAKQHVKMARGIGGGRKRKSRKNKRKSRKNKRKSRRKKTKKRRRKKYRGGNCNFKLNKFKRHTGGAYSQYGSNEPNSPTYSFEPTTTRPWALGPGNFKRTVNKF